MNTAARSVRNCTGTLVSERVVVTAAHCVWNILTKRWLPPEYVHFVAGYQRGSHPAHSVGRRLVVPVDHEPERGRPNELGDFAHDWALLELEQPLGRDVGYVGWGLLDPKSWRRLGGERAVFASVGYRGDRPHVQTVDRECRLDRFELKDQLVLHRCPITRGDSGGPMLLRVDDTYFVVGIHVGLWQDPAGSFGVMLPSSRLVDRLADLDVAGSRLKGATPFFGRRGRRSYSPSLRPEAEAGRRPHGADDTDSEFDR